MNRIANPGSAAFCRFGKGGGSVMTRTILVVEDDDATREGFASVLEQAGYRVALACTGQDALEYLQTHTAPDLIILDMFMPGMDGWYFLKLWKRHWETVPVLVTTALKVGSDEWATSLGACAWLEKPVDPESLLPKVRECFRQGG
jgi:DNA-binding response OmpR family regulator